MPVIFEAIMVDGDEVSEGSEHYLLEQRRRCALGWHELH